MSRLPLLVVAALLCGCKVHDRPVEPPLRHASGLRDPEVVTSAVRSLAEAARREVVPWPAHLPRSRDFPELPLLRVSEVEDLGRTGADVAALTRAVEHEVRRQRFVRLSIDEEAVPAWLREPPDGKAAPPAREAPPRAALLLRAWTDRSGRLRLELQDLVTGRPLVKATSR
ncbi:MAG: hypothetical protein M9894_38520 [Planctomycetes bacterium]|nr:hypothetical protein [Planctomycetota bacterium]